MIAKRKEQEEQDDPNEEDEEVEAFENQADRKTHRKKQKRMLAYGIRE